MFWGLLLAHGSISGSIKEGCACPGLRRRNLMHVRMAERVSLASFVSGVRNWRGDGGTGGGGAQRPVTEAWAGASSAVPSAGLILHHQGLAEKP